MAIDETLVKRIRTILHTKKLTVVERRMFGGVAFMVNGNMAVGIMYDGKFMARVGKEQNEESLRLPYAKQMQFKKPMNGYIAVEPEGVANDVDLSTWIERCLAFNKALPVKI